MENQLCLFHCTLCGGVLHSDDPEAAPRCCGAEMYLAFVQSTANWNRNSKESLLELMLDEYEHREYENAEACRSLD